MSDVIVKGEFHSSRGDFREEREILAEGVDTLVIEGNEHETTVSWFHSWFSVAMIIFEHLFASFLYTDHQTLVDIAKGQGADVVYTRETNTALLEDSHNLVVATSCILFYVLILASILAGTLGAKLIGGMSLLAAGPVPILVLRIHDSWKSVNNRDEKIAEKIESAAEDGDRVVVVVGQGHVKNALGYLSEEIDVDTREPAYDYFSFSMGRDLVVSVVRIFGMMVVVYPVFIFVSKFIIL